MRPATTLLVRNVNEALPRALLLLKEHGKRVSPRGMATLEYPGPVITSYKFPDEMVLFNPLRDANPFFHFFESLWILAGRMDVAFLKFFNSRMAEYSDDGVTFHAPYGFRLRSAQEVDQIEACIEKLRTDPDSRQAVMQIWDADSDLTVRSKDIPCNDLIFLKIRDKELHMTVCCRSNDVVWGAYGANAVQFGTLLKYMAGRIGVQVGTYVQISDSFHVYEDLPYWKKWLEICSISAYDPYSSGQLKPADLNAWLTRDSLISGDFDRDLKTFFSLYDQEGISGDIGLPQKYVTSDFQRVVAPMLNSILTHKTGDTEGAIFCVEHRVTAGDWGLAAKQWLQRRQEPK